MQDEKTIKEVVKSKYAEIAVSDGRKSCCGSKTSKIIDYTMMKDDYSGLEGYVADADLGLGCGLPTEIAAIKPGDIVIDLGCGAGNDVFVAAKITGEAGKVIGIDMTEEMLDKARSNMEKLGVKNVEFRFGEIEQLPVENDIADVIVSNCVLNLVPDKKAAFAEMFRVLKPGGHFSVSDIVLRGNLPQGLLQSAEMYAGCIAGAIAQEEYISLLEQTGFKNVSVKKTKTIALPETILQQYLQAEEIEQYKNSKTGIYSITVYGEK